MPRKKEARVIHDDGSLSLNKYISDSGFCSRRESDTYIEQGRVSINGIEAAKGNRVMPGDVVEIDGEPIRKKVKTVYLAFNKPMDVTTTTDTTEPKNIISYINFSQRIFPIGRLDKDSEGLIFLTNDGDIVNKILRAGNQHEKEYIVTVEQPITPEFIKQMSDGMKLGPGEYTKPCKVVALGKSAFRIILTQGLNRQIRRMCSACGYKVARLKRIRIMNVQLGNLPLGQWRYLTADEIELIKKMVAESSNAEQASYIAKPVKTPKPAKPAPAPTAKKETKADYKKSIKPKGSYGHFKKVGEERKRKKG